MRSGEDRAEQAPLAEIYDFQPTGLQVSTEALLALAAVNAGYNDLVVRAQELLREHRLDPIQLGLMEADLRQINLRKEQAGAAALRELELDIEVQDYTIDENSGHVYRLVRRVPA